MLYICQNLVSHSILVFLANWFIVSCNNFFFFLIRLYLATLITLNREFIHHLTHQQVTNFSTLHLSIMVSPTFIFYLTLTLFLFLNVSTSTKTILVDKSGKGQFTTVQKAIDSIPSNNKQWTIIHLNAGVYK